MSTQPVGSQPSGGQRSGNRLATEVSPYLLQHAGNPVAWQPWGEPAFAEARARDVPIFLSIGYSTCYWCHVMERESFESPTIAAALNERFVSIKVDREQRPDVDELYMAATLAMTGRGGWPMTVFLEPQRLRPFWAGTYFPPEPRHGMTSFPGVLAGIARAWAEQRQAVLEQAELLAQAVREHVAASVEPAPVGPEQIERAVGTLLRMVDRTHGGFGGAPKFPQPALGDFLLSVRNALDDDGRRAVDAAVRLTLDRMALGGIRDHVGGGFHRYATDAVWLVPHFEKMLYDNAQLASLYARAALVYDDTEYRRVVRDILEYVRREMALPGGGFASAQDAEVNHREGFNYLWTSAQLVETLGEHDGAWAARIYGVDLGPNFRDPHHPGDPPANVLRLAALPEQLAAEQGVPADDLLARLQRVNRALRSARMRREQPARDDKVIASWNGLMIAACARGAALLRDRSFYDMADRAARFVLEHMGSGGRLLRVWRDARTGTTGVLEDSAMIISGLLALHEAATEFDVDASFAIDAARRIALAAGTDFGDGAGGFFDTRAEQADLFVRARTTHDGAMPCGWSAMVSALVDLARASRDPADADRAASALAAISGVIARAPVPAIVATHALHRALADPLLRERVLSRLPAHPAPAPEERALDEAQPDPTPVAIYADRERVEVGPDEPAELWLVLRIAEGAHVVAADPGPAGAALMPFRVGLVSGSGVAVYADYPPGEPAQEDVLAYSGEVRVRVAIERASGTFVRPILGVHAQACTERECLTPITLELDVAIDLRP